MVGVEGFDDPSTLFPFVRSSDSAQTTKIIVTMRYDSFTGRERKKD